MDLLCFCELESQEGEKKQMLMRFLAKLRPFLNASQEIEADSRRVSGFSTMIIEKPSTFKIWGFSKISGMQCSCYEVLQFGDCLFEQDGW